MRAVFAEIVQEVRDVGHLTFVRPVREGRPRPSDWPRGLREVGAAAAGVFVLLGLAILLAVPLRRLDDLDLGANSLSGVPSLTLPLLLVGALLSLTLALTAALHVSWWLRLVLLVIGGSVVVFFTVHSWTNPSLLLVTAASYLALVVFTFLRARRGYAWWEFVVVAALLVCATVLPWAFSGDGFAWGIDLRPSTLEGALLTLQPLILPAVMVAGSAPAQIVVDGAQTAASRPVSTGPFLTGFGLSVVWLAVSLWQWTGTDAVTVPALAGAAVALSLTVGLVGLALRRAGVSAPPQPRHYPEVWGAWLYPLAVAMTLLVVITFPFIIAREAAALAQLPAMAQGVDAALNLVMDNNPGIWERGLLGVVVLGIAWRLSARSRLTEAVGLAAFAVLVLLDLFGLAPPLAFLQDRSTEGMGLIASGVALVAALVALVRKRFDRGIAVGVMTVVLLAVLYPHRDLLDDPVGFALAFSGPVVLVFGLAWRVVTEAQVTYSGTPRYPQSTRVLLFLANTLFATTGVAYVTLERGLGTDADPTAWGALGDSMLGDPLYLAGLVAGLWMVLRPVGEGMGSAGLGPGAGGAGGEAVPSGGQPGVPVVAHDGRPVGLYGVHPEAEDGAVGRLG